MHAEDAEHLVAAALDDREADRTEWHVAVDEPEVLAVDLT